MRAEVIPLFFVTQGGSAAESLRMVTVNPQHSLIAPVKMTATFLTAGEPNIVAPFRQLNPRRPNHYAFDPSSFAQPAQLGIIGDSPRTVCCGPGINGFDLALLKDTAVSERTELQFRAEFFNLFNHTQFVNPDGNISDGATFGTVVRARDPRLIQFAVKLVF